jgi:hypothetical protein
MVTVVYNKSFADAEMLEDVLKYRVGGDFSYNVGEVVNGFS